MTHKEERMFNIAREISLLSNLHRARVGAVVVTGNRILSTACNSQIPKEHAEIAALSPLIGKEIEWSKVSIFTYRELKNGKHACSRPCPACSRLIRDLGIKNVYYVDENGNFVKERYI